MNKNHLVINRDGLTLSADLLGDVDQPLVLLVHGFPDTPKSWHAVAEKLVHAGYCVLMPWLRGYTLESCSNTAHYDHLAAGEDLNAWRLTLGKAKAHLVGHDWGALAAMSVATRQPEGWASLSSLAIPPFQRAELAWRLLPTQLRMSAYMLRMQSTHAGTLIRRNDCAYLRQLWQTWSPSWHFSEAQFQPVREAFSHPAVAHASTRYYRALFTLQQSQTRAALASVRQTISVPTLFMSGLADGCMHRKLLTTLTDPMRFPAGIDSVHLPDCGHFLQAEQPELVSMELLRHFARYPA